VFGLAGVLGVAARLLQLRLQFLNAQEMALRDLWRR
jgi:hypothetical protein